MRVSVLDALPLARVDSNGKLAQLGLLLAGFLLISPFLLSGRVALLLAVMLGLGFALLSVRELMPTVILLVALSTELMGAWSGDAMPYLQLAAGMRLTLRDALLLGVLPIAVLRLRRRGEVPIFTVPLLGVAVAVGVAFVQGLTTDGDLNAPLNLLRPLFSYMLYFVVVAAVDSRRKLGWLLSAIFATAVVAVAIQAYEAAAGQPLPFLGAALRAEHTLHGITVGGDVVPYLWNRAPLLLFLSLFLALGHMFQGRSGVPHATLAFVCLLGFVIALVRSWYVFIAAGALVMLLASRDARLWVRVGVGALTLGAAALAVDALAGGFVAQQYGRSLVEVWLARAQTLLTFQQETNYLGRVSTLEWQWDRVLQAPFLGYGLSRSFSLFSSADTGVVNTLLMFGLVGFVPFLALIARAVQLSVLACTRLAASPDRGYALGLLGMWGGLLVGYATSWDFFTHFQGAWLPALALAIGDRLWSFGSAQRAEALSATAPVAPTDADQRRSAQTPPRLPGAPWPTRVRGVDQTPPGP